MPDRRQALLTVLLAASVALLARPGVAHHASTHDQNPAPPPALGPTQILNFAAGALIIPMDGCYQRPSFMSDQDLNEIVAPLTATSALCNATKDDGLIPAYSLMLRLIQKGIPVHWAVRAGKTSWSDVDFSVVRAGGAPVSRKNPGTAPNPTRYASITTVRYRGAPFVIAASHATAALAAMDTLANTCDQGTCYSAVDVHIARVSFDAPIYRTLTTLPKLAVVDLRDGTMGSDRTNFTAGSLTEALLDGLRGTLWDWVSVDQVLAGGLSSYQLAWVPPFDLPTTPTTRQRSFMAKLGAFADAGGSIVLQDGAVGGAEGYGAMSGSTFAASQLPTFGFQTAGGIVANGTGGTWDNGNDNELTFGQDYSDPAAQFGGIVWTGIGGSKFNWRPRYDKAYLPGVRRMIYSYHTSNDALRRWDFATWRHKDNDATKGRIYYLGGFHWRRVTAAGFRLLLNTIMIAQVPAQSVVIELARSAPIVATVGGVETQFAGTYESVLPPASTPTYSTTADAATYEFPWVRGHFRGIDLARLPSGETSFASTAGQRAVLFDAGTRLPSVRRIFTDTGSPSSPTETTIATSNRAVLAPMLGVAGAADADVLIARIHAGRKSGGVYVPRLGGIDRSTVAVIEASPMIPNGRPTMAYVGATDGMLHAFCVEAGGPCSAPGVELWAFLPSSELAKVRTNRTRLDGSPTVADVSGMFGGQRGLRTVLVFQSGNQAPSATYAVDITNPATPDVLWKVPTPGPGIRTALGWVLDGTSITSMTYVQSAFAATSPSGGFEVRAVVTATGEVRWLKQFPYPAPRRAANPAVPRTGIPGGVSLVPDRARRLTSTVLVPTLYGQVYALDARTGENLYGAAPLFDFGEDFHPIGASIAVYQDRDDGLLRALVVSGGFADPFAPSAVEWAPDDVRQYAVGFPVAPDPTTAVPITRAKVALDRRLGVHIDFGAGQRAFSPAVIAGNEIFVTTDSANVNAADYGTAGTPTGRLWRQVIGGGLRSVVIASGAASVDVAIETGAVIANGRNGVVRENPTSFDRAGDGVELRPTMRGFRLLWLRVR